jgi:transcription initiation factor TFIID subunit 7
MEEVFVLRAPPALAERLRRILAEDRQAADDLELQFGEDGRTGTLKVGSDVFPAKLLDLPTKVESWKTLDDTNLVKAADIGQVIVVAPPGGALPTEDVSVDGVTLAMRCVRWLHVPQSFLVLCSPPRLPPGTRSARTSASRWSLTGTESPRLSRSWRSSSVEARW